VFIVEYFGSSAASVLSAENAERTAREEATALVNTYLAKCQEAGVSLHNIDQSEILRDIPVFFFHLLVVCFNLSYCDKKSCKASSVMAMYVM
jgi:hypothetical protein